MDPCEFKKQVKSLGWSYAEAVRRLSDEHSDLDVGTSRLKAA